VGYLVRTITKEELKNIHISWAALEGWNPGLHDEEAMYDVDPDGYFIGLLDNEPIACISAVSWNKDFGFVGFYIVRPEFRGKGYGWKIWNESLKHLPTQNIGIDGVVAQQDNYKKSGFKLVYNNIRFEGISNKFRDKDKRIYSTDKILFKDLSDYDREMFPLNRDVFLQKWIKLPESFSFVIVEEQKIRGYVVIRKCIKGYKIAPLFADSIKYARVLFGACNNVVPEGNPVYLDAPDINTEAKKLAEENKMNKVFETARMYTRNNPEININKIFGVTTFEIG